jgi:hypothetical protein
VGKGRPGPRPEIWISGPDQVRHKQHCAWRQQKNQAQWRGETWALTFDVWIELWGDLWPRRGRQVDDYCMTRRDWELPWTRANTHVITRSEHAKMQGRHMSDGWVSPARQRWRAETGIAKKKPGPRPRPPV